MNLKICYRKHTIEFAVSAAFVTALASTIALLAT